MELLELSPDTFDYHCPFNVSHTMPHKTLIKHLIKCPDKPPDFKSCPFNISHVMHESKLEEHEKICPDKILIELAIYESSEIKRPIPNIGYTPNIEYEESWDGLEQTSDVLTNISDVILMKAKNGSTKSERKKHRMFLHENDVKNNNETNKDNNGNKPNGSVLKIDNQKKQQQGQQQHDSKSYFIGHRP
jgi:hypothetical protein